MRELRQWQEECRLVEDMRTNALDALRCLEMEVSDLQTTGKDLHSSKESYSKLQQQVCHSFWRFLNIENKKLISTWNSNDSHWQIKKIFYPDNIYYTKLRRNIVLAGFVSIWYFNWYTSGGRTASYSDLYLVKSWLDLVLSYGYFYLTWCQ